MKKIMLEIGKIYKTKNGRDVQIVYREKNKMFDFVGFDINTDMILYYRQDGIAHAFDPDDMNMDIMQEIDNDTKSNQSEIVTHTLENGARVVEVEMNNRALGVMVKHHNKTTTIMVIPFEDDIYINMNGGH